MLQFSNLTALPHIQHRILGKGEEDQWPRDVFVIAKQMHSDRAVWVNVETPNPIPQGDALLTRSSDIILGIRVADCVSVLFAEPRLRIVGAIHAGWRGTALEITRKTLEALKIKPFQLRVGIGPAICPNCFVVGEEVARQFDQSVVRESNDEEGKFHVDLWQANVNQCLEVGVPERNIEVMDICTVEQNDLYSVRRGTSEKRNLAFIAMR